MSVVGIIGPGSWANIVPSSPVEGALYIAKAPITGFPGGGVPVDQDALGWNGTQWINYGLLGTNGEQGEQGPEGPEGPIGPAGGVNSINGEQGDVVIDGLAGLTADLPIVFTNNNLSFSLAALPALP